MLKPTIIVVVFIFVLLGYAGFAMRASWIKDKVAALSGPASLAYAARNSNIPPKGAKPRIVLIGDSRIAQWPAEAFGDKWEVINRGIGGETVQQLARRFDADARALDPDVIVIEAGINDLVAASFMSEEDGAVVARNAAETLKTLIHQGINAGTKILLIPIIPPGHPDMLRRLLWNQSLRALVSNVNSFLRQLELSSDVIVVNLPSKLFDNYGALEPKYSFDALHLNAEGYDLVSKALLTSLELALRSNRSKQD